MDVEKLYQDKIIDPETKACYLFISSTKEASSCPHCHDFFEIMLVVNGRAIHHINGQEKAIHSGSLIFIKPDDIHYFGELGNFDCQFINIAFSIKTLYEIANYLGEGFTINTLLTASEVPSVNLSEIEKNIFKQKIESLFSTPITKKKYIKMELRALILHILVNYFISAPRFNSNKVPLWFEEMCLVMNKKENFIQGIKMMENLVGKSHEHICRAFKKYYGITPINFINDLKMNYSDNLLTNSNLSILKISAESGYESLSHFYYVFKNKFGVPPADFRRQRQKSSYLI